MRHGCIDDPMNHDRAPTNPQSPRDGIAAFVEQVTRSDLGRRALAGLETAQPGCKAGFWRLFRGHVLRLFPGENPEVLPSSAAEVHLENPEVEALGRGATIVPKRAPNRLFAPLLLDGRLIGALGLEAPEEVEWNEIERSRLASSADLVASGSAALASATSRHRRELARVVESASDLMWLVGADLGIRSVSSASERLLGLTPQATVGNSFVDPVHPDDRPRVREWFERTLAGGTDPIHFRTLSESQQWIWLEASGEPITAPDGTDADAVAVIARDVTDMRRAEGARRLAQEIFEVAGKLAGVGSWAYDLERQETWWSRQTYRIVDRDPSLRPLTADEIIAKILDVDRRAFVEAHERVADRRSPAESCSFRLRNDHGSVLFLQTHISYRERGILGNPSLIGCVVDHTDRKRLQTRLAAAERLRSLGRLGSTVAHDFRNVLMAIEVTAEGLRSNNPPETSPGFDELLEQVRSGQELTNQLMRLARRPSPELVPTDLNQFLRKLEPQLRRQLGSRMDLELSLAPELWPVELDPSYFEQVVVNLVTNGLEACESEGRLWIETANEPGVDADSGTVLLTVSDSGPGIPPERLPRIFDPLYTTKPGGHGLGLVSVLDIVTAHLGTVEAGNLSGPGARFSVRLPRRTDLPSLLSEEAPPRPDPTIVLVDDEPLLLRSVAAALGRLGYPVATAESGERALDYLGNRLDRTELVITDVNMPGMDGWELARRLRNRRVDLPVVFLSGLPRGSQHDLGERDRFLAKPVSARTIADTIRDLCPHLAVPPSGV